VFREPQTLTLTLKGLVRKGYTPKQAKEWKAACLPRTGEARQERNQGIKARADPQRKSTGGGIAGIAKKVQCPLGGKRGQLTSLSERQKIIGWITEAVEAGARRKQASQALGLSARTLQRWVEGDKVKEDQRPLITRPAPNNKLSEAERSHIVAVCNQPEYASVPPGQIVPRLADKGQYLASESTFYRILGEAGQQNHRGRSKAMKRRKPPTTHIATGATQVWSWDISYLPGPVRGLYHSLYLVEDIYSRTKRKRGQNQYNDFPPFL